MLAKDFLWDLILDFKNRPRIFKFCFKISKCWPKIFFRNFFSDSKILTKDFLRNFCFNLQNYININLFFTEKYPLSDHSFSSFAFWYHESKSIHLFRSDISNNFFDFSSMLIFDRSILSNRIDNSQSLKYVWT